ncbi:hypothetical protein Emin_1133 [Elusimicrobium minutum Pei191]|uniref:NADH-quinone oxidoreductase subunit n=1 Tax=Elusimicrobium minutum (strain Pei191) TaxID=445932 RepID=B2KDT9_ELUMP|nr:NADH-quinone oxidoreductase subunit A [Elusimicrobium minutum]ACC98685.1 hypothetical protein Emin_1133 [Elusimicrobium minutum Pei191]
MAEILLYPPIVFLTVFLLVWLFSKLTANFAPKANNKPEGKLAPYACGEEYTGKKVNPDYNSFFPFAIFFTVLHVSGLIIATLAAASVSWVTAGFAIIYIVSVLTVVAVLYAK